MYRHPAWTVGNTIAAYQLPELVFTEQIGHPVFGKLLIRFERREVLGQEPRVDEGAGDAVEGAEELLEEFRVAPRQVI